MKTDHHLCSGQRLRILPVTCGHSIKPTTWQFAWDFYSLRVFLTPSSVLKKNQVFWNHFMLRQIRTARWRENILIYITILLFTSSFSIESVCLKKATLLFGLRLQTNPTLQNQSTTKSFCLKTWKIQDCGHQILSATQVIYFVCNTRNINICVRV